MRKIFLKSKNEGYTLVETLVAVSIFSVSILGLLVALSQGLADTGYAKKKIAAAYLAQEGIEYIRNMRDTFVIYDAVGPQEGWTAFIDYVSPSCASEFGCYFDDSNLVYTNPNKPMAGILINACDGTCPELLFNSATGKYGYIGESSGLIRKIQVASITADEVKITSTVFWSQASGNYSVVFSNNLLNWIE